MQQKMEETAPIAVQCCKTLKFMEAQVAPQPF